MKLAQRASFLVVGVVALATAACFRIGQDDIGGGESIYQGQEPQVADDCKPTFESLYTGYFSAQGSAGCGAATCHAGPGTPGTAGSGGFDCSSKATCYDTMKATSLLGTPANPTSATLYSIVRHDKNGKVVGSMPKGSAYTFSPKAMGCIEQWLGAGAKNE